MAIPSSSRRLPSEAGAAGAKPSQGGRYRRSARREAPGDRPAPRPLPVQDQYYKTRHDRSPGELIEKITEFRKAKQFRDVEAALRGA